MLLRKLRELYSCYYLFRYRPPLPEGATLPLIQATFAYLKWAAAVQRPTGHSKVTFGKALECGGHLVDHFIRMGSLSLCLCTRAVRIGVYPLSNSLEFLEQIGSKVGKIACMLD